MVHTSGRLGALEEAASLYSQAVRTLTRALGPADELTLAARAGYALVLQDQGDRALLMQTQCPHRYAPEEVRGVFEFVIAGYAETLGPEHEDTLSMTLHLAEFLWEIAQEPAALPAAQFALLDDGNIELLGASIHDDSAAAQVAAAALQAGTVQLEPGDIDPELDGDVDLLSLRKRHADAASLHVHAMQQLRRQKILLQDEINLFKDGSASKITAMHDTIAELETSVAELDQDRKALKRELNAKERKLELSLTPRQQELKLKRQQKAAMRKKQHTLPPGTSQALEGARSKAELKRHRMELAGERRSFMVCLSVFALSYQ